MGGFRASPHRTDGTTVLAASAPRPTGESRSAGTAFRPDVQGLRAIAVGLVVVYHLVPTALSGGYIGVDVFFVISGYLITGLLARELRRDSRVDLLAFYGRRARRLLPAAATVLTAVLVASCLLLPVTRLPETLKEIISSALYFQNWTLAHDAIDYLTIGNAASPVQHFWSLSVEEQFYLVWPLAFLAAGLAMRRLGRRAGIAMGLTLAGAVVAASLFWSIHLTRIDAASAYFVTTTRMWEFGVGGLLMLLPASATRAIATQWWLGWLGLGAIGYAAWTIDAATRFPGTAALLPVLGTAAVLAAATGRFGVGQLTGRRPMVFIGDISYSLYLWHWPLIVLWQTYSGHAIRPREAVAIAAASVLLAWLTKKLVEDPIRLAPLIARYRWRSLATALTVLVPVAAVLIIDVRTPAPTRGRLDADHQGAAVLAGDAIASHAAAIPSVGAAPNDTPAYYSQSCETSVTSSRLELCTFGDTADPVETIALVGDSTAGQWLSPLAAIAKAHRWKIVTMLHSECPFTATLTYDTNSKIAYKTCQQWGRTAQRALLAMQPRAVITSDRPNSGTPSIKSSTSPTSLADVGNGMATYWAQLLDAGIRVVGIHESPEAHKNIPDCLAGRGGSVRSCSVPTSSALTENTPEDVAAEQLHGAVPILDLNQLICSVATCAPIVGNVVVYRDDHHLTNTYALSLRPYLEKQLLDTGAV